MRVKLNHFRMLIIAFLMLLLPKQLAAYTKGDIVKHDDIIYQVVSDTENTLSFVGTEKTKTGAVNIPATWSDGRGIMFKVTEVGGNETYKCEGVTDITLPEGVTKIAYAAFAGAKLKTLKIPSTVTDISTNAFYRVQELPKVTVDHSNAKFCDDGHGALYSKDKTELYAVPTNADNVPNGTYTVDTAVKKIHHSAFINTSNTPGIKKIILPPHLELVEADYPSCVQLNTLEEYEMPTGASGPYKVIGGVLFKDKALVQYPRNKKEQNYKVPDGITEIAPRAIDASRNMRSIDLNKVTKLGLTSIYSCENLETVTLPKDLQVEGTAGAIANCPKIKEYKAANDCVNFVVEDGIVYSKDKTRVYFFPPAKDIADGKYTILSTVKVIEKLAFAGNKNIQELTIPSSVTNINSQALSVFAKLQKVTFDNPSNCSKIEGGAFGWNYKLKEITLPSALTELDKIFTACNDMETINVPNDSKLRKIKNGALQLTKNLKHFNFQGTCALDTIEAGAFQNLEQLEGFDFPKGVTTIGANAFNGCKKMTTATFKDDAVIQTIAAGALADCGLTSIKIPNSVKTLEKEAFRNCSALTTVTLSKNVDSISSEAFKRCEKLTAINVDKDNTKYSSVDGYLLSHDKKELILFPHGKANKNFTLLPPSITKIGDYAFYDCVGLENVVIPNKVEEIGERAFSLCTKLNTITFLCDKMIDPAKINQLDNKRSFDNGSSGTTDMPTKIDIYVRKELLTKYKGESFYNHFKSINTSFENDNLEYLPVSNSSVDLLDVKKTDYTFVVPDKVTHDGKTYNVSMIGDYAFQNTTNAVHEVVVKKNVEYIGAKAFKTKIDDNTSTIERVFLLATNPTEKMLSTTRFELDETKTNYNEFAPTTEIYVKKSAWNTYKTKWHKKVYDQNVHAEVESSMNFINQIDYKIQDVKITHKYGTFSREFDVDFSEYKKEKNSCDIGAFVAPVSGITQGPGDYGTSKYKVRMVSVDEKGGLAGEYGYVPAETGVLLKVLDVDSTPSGFFYTIGEKDNQTYSINDNMMKGVTVNKKTVTKGSNPFYVVSANKGVFMKAPSPTFEMPIHKAYAEITGVPAGAKVMFSFTDDNSSTTGIDTIDTSSSATSSDNAYYNLNGQRIEKPQHGVYIHGGKKVIIK